jgi:hypothetical protein
MTTFPSKARRKRNTGCVYTGAVGVKMRPISYRTKQPRPKYTRVQLRGGPLCGQAITLDFDGQITTLPIVLHGQAGRYVYGNWVPDGS